MVRREQGQSWNTHLRGMSFDVEVGVRKLNIVARFQTILPMELVFELDGPQLEQLHVTPDGWHLPGLHIAVHTDASTPTVVQSGSRSEIVYAVDNSNGGSDVLHFALTLHEQ